MVVGGGSRELAERQERSGVQQSKSELVQVDVFGISWYPFRYKI